MALADLGDLERKLGDPRELTRGRLDANDRGQLVTERARVELGAVAGDDARLLEALDPLGDRRGGEVDAPAELGERHAAVCGEFADDLTVGWVDLPKIAGIHAHKSVLCSEIAP